MGVWTWEAFRPLCSFQTVNSALLFSPILPSSSTLGLFMHVIAKLAAVRGYRQILMPHPIRPHFYPDCSTAVPAPRLPPLPLHHYPLPAPDVLAITNDLCSPLRLRAEKPVDKQVTSNKGLPAPTEESKAPGLIPQNEETLACCSGNAFQTAPMHSGTLELNSNCNNQVKRVIPVFQIDGLPPAAWSH